MTSTTGKAGHPDVDEISALAEGLLSPSLAADVQKHLSECADCSDTHAALEEIRELLGTVPTPEPMPMDVVERIDAALAAEALRTVSASVSAPEAGSLASADTVARNDSSESVDTSPRSDSGDHAADHRSKQRIETHVSRETSPSDTSSPSGDRPTGHPRGSTGPGRGSRDRLRRRRKVITMGSVFTAVVIGLGTVLLQTVMNGSSDPSANGVPPSETRHTFSSGNLQGEVTTLLKDHGGPVKTPKTSGSATPKPSLDLASPDVTPSPTVTKSASPLYSGIAVDIPDCVRNGIGRREAPIAAERGTFEGTDAYLVLFPHATDSSRVSAYVVDATCADKPAGPLGAILLSGSYPR